MDASFFIDGVQAVGFPVAMCGALFWYMIKQDEKHTKEVDTLRKAIENNTKILTRLYERIGGEKENG